MPESRRDAILILLSLTAGCVDAMAFLSSGVFPANMTGNSVVLALFLARASVDGVLLSGLALLGYCVGAVLGSWLTHSPQPSRQWSSKTSLTLLIGGVILLACAAALGLFGESLLPLLIPLTAAAMGMQSAAVLRLGVGGIATVVITGTLTTALMRLTGKVVDPSANMESPWLPALSWFAYFVGALLGALPSLLHQTWLVMLPGILLTGIALAGYAKAEAT